MSIILDKVYYTYDENTAFETRALTNVSAQIGDGEFVGIIGHTGSGKSTLALHLNGLLRPTSGGVYFNGRDIHEDDFDRKGLRGKVGLVFQYPERQLFEATVFDDVCFGPMNFGYSSKDAQLLAFRALHSVGLPEEDWYRSPLELSGGQKRLAAIAGVLASKPEVLILDEPAAGLDPEGREGMFGLLERLHEEMRMTIVLLSHSMEEVAERAGRLIVMDHGRVLLDGAPCEVFSHFGELERAGLSAPEFAYLIRDLRERGFPVSEGAVTLREARDDILRALGML